MLDMNICYTGQRRSTVSGYYLLGNGYRGFNPILKRFAGQDGMSPFGKGGAHGFLYCNDDPVNQKDPSGKGPLLWLFGECFAWVYGAIEESIAETSVADAALSKGIRRSRMQSWPLSDAAKNSTTVLTEQEQATTGFQQIKKEIGYIGDRDGQGTSVLVIHGDKKGNVGFYDGTLMLDRVPDRGRYVKYGSAEEMVAGLKALKGIDLSVGQGPLHFVSCYMGNSEFAKSLAKATKRTVITYGDSEMVRTHDLEHIKLSKKGVLDVRWNRFEYIRLRPNFDTYL